MLCVTKAKNSAPGLSSKAENKIPADTAVVAEVVTLEVSGFGLNCCLPMIYMVICTIKSLQGSCNRSSASGKKIKFQKSVAEIKNARGYQHPVLP